MNNWLLWLVFASVIKQCYCKTSLSLSVANHVVDVVHKGKWLTYHPSFSQLRDLQNKLTDVINTVQENTQNICQCGFSLQHISDGTFECFSNLDEVTFWNRQTKWIYYKWMWSVYGVKIHFLYYRHAIGPLLKHKESCLPCKHMASLRWQGSLSAKVNKNTTLAYSHDRV